MYAINRKGIMSQPYFVYIYRKPCKHWTSWTHNSSKWLTPHTTTLTNRFRNKKRCSLNTNLHNFSLNVRLRGSGLCSFIPSLPLSFFVLSLQLYSGLSLVRRPSGWMKFPFLLYLKLNAVARKQMTRRMTSRGYTVDIVSQSCEFNHPQ